MARKRFSVAWILVLMVPGLLYAAEPESPFLRKNALAVKLGYHFYPTSDFTDYWKVSQQDFDGFVGEIAYERELVKYLGLEVGLGYYSSNKQYFYNNLVSSGDQATLDATITNTYLSLTLKPHFPLARWFQVYFGAGGDVYYTYTDFKGSYTRGGSSTSLDNSDNKLAVGLHGLAGAEVLLFEKPWERGVYDMAMSLFLEYKYAFVPINNFDEAMINRINSFAGSSVGSHDFNAGGHFIFTGLRWKF
jgi:opacity protein-like surface antigen